MMGRRAAITSFNEVQIVQGVGLLAAASTGSALNSSPVKAAPSCARTTWSGGHRSLGEPVLVAQDLDNLLKSPWDFLVTSGPG